MEYTLSFSYPTGMLLESWNSVIPANHPSINRLTLLAVFSASASEDVGDKGLIGLREGELSTLET